MRVAGSDSDAGTDRLIIIGRVAGVYGVQGWVKVVSYTRPPKNILEYAPWLLQTQQGRETRSVQEGRIQGKGLIAQLQGVEDREQARQLIEADIIVPRAQLPALPAGEYYWCDLMGLELVNQAGQVLGKVVELRETGANDVMVVQGGQRHLVPFVMGQFIKEVDLDAGRILVDWHAE